ncbi:hypothetical protein M8J77_015318 [Diaphorina citri]|nr:hypothetical protein M8J77_015318 [Diaphorina citri]
MPYEPFDYTEPNISRAYASSTRFYSKGMGHLYYFTNLFINTILKDQAYPEDVGAFARGRTRDASMNVSVIVCMWKTPLSLS